MTQDIRELRKALERQRRLPLWITHLRQRLHSHNRLGLILGAGVSVDAGCPLWKELVERLGERLPNAEASMTAHRKAGVSEPYLTQILYHLHRAEIQRESSGVPVEFEGFQVASTWMESVHQELFRGISGKTFEQIKASHSYLEELGEMCWRSGFTVNFNFDDIVDEAAIDYSQKHHLDAPEIIYRPRVETRRNVPVIFHINGLLPRESSRRKSDFLTFTEDAFAEVMISPGSADAEFTMSRFATTTFLLLGTSLNDNSLKNMLRAGLKRNSANHHYIVYWEDSANPKSDEERDHIFEVNLEVYNVISIFLETAQIKEFLQLVNQPDVGAFESDVLRLAEALPKPFSTRRRYYLVGSVASGKSTNLEALRCFTTFEEWAGRTPATLYQDHASLTEEQRRAIDDWLYGQLRLKNDRMRGTGPGIHIMDRGYLDLFAFSNESKENVEKADLLRTRVRSVTGSLERGHILFIEADEKNLSERQARRGKLKGAERKVDYNGSKLKDQGALLKKVYRPAEDSIFETSNESCGVTARRIARLILLGEYETFDFEARIDQIRAAGGVP